MNHFEIVMFREIDQTIGKKPKKLKKYEFFKIF